MALPREPPVESLQSRLLVLNEDTALIQSLSRVLQSSLPALALDSSSSPSRAQLLFETSAYHAVICSPRLMFVDGWSFLTRSRAMQPPLPFLLTLRPDEGKRVEEWLNLGVYDFILRPLNPSQALESIQDALVLSKWRARIVHKKQALVQLRRRREQYLFTTTNGPLRQHVGALLLSSIARLEESAEAYKQTVNRIEANLLALHRACQNSEIHARERARNRLRTDLGR